MVSGAFERPDPKGWRCSCLKKYRFLVSRRRHSHRVDAKGPFAGAQLPTDCITTAKSRLQTLEAENRKGNKKKSQLEDERNDVGVF